MAADDSMTSAKQDGAAGAAARGTTAAPPPSPLPPPPPAAASDASRPAPQGWPEAAADEAQQCSHAVPCTSSRSSKVTGGDAAAAAEAVLASRSSLGSSRRGAQPVVLRVEVASKALAQFLTWTMLVLNLLFVWMAISMLGLRQADFWEVGQLRPYYSVEEIIGCCCLLLLVLQLAYFLFSVRHSHREGRIWSKRQRYFGVTALVLLVLQTIYSAVFVAAYGAVLGTGACGYPWKALAVLEFVQWLAFISIMLFILARLQLVMIYRGPGALDMHPDFRLELDRPLKERPLKLKVLLGAWLLVMALGIVSMVHKLRTYGDSGLVVEGCNASLDSWQCPPSGIQIASAVVVLVLLVAYLAAWLWTLSRVLRDHENLPWCKYRSTHMFARIQGRLFGSVITCVALATVFLSLVPAFQNNCWSAMDARMGNLPVNLSLTLAACVFSFLYMPLSRAFDSPVLQDFNSRFAWTQASLAREMERRNREVLDVAVYAHKVALQSQASFTHVMDFLPDTIARLVGQPDFDAALAKLEREPMFCMETAVKLFYWMRLAYRDDDALINPFVNAHLALPLFDLHHFEMIWDDSTDTHACLGYSSTQVVVAFRGTQTMQNILTDIKAWMVPLQPKQRHGGKVLKAHAGFLGAWLHDGFNRKVLARLRELQDQSSQPLRLWVCGHSLGGALAVLAAPEIQAQHPASKLTCYVYGCPRVGNRAFRRAFTAAVPDCWEIRNGQDPIPWIPKWGFHRSGRGVTIDSQGNCALRPTYFELSVTHRGTSARDHLTGGYAKSFAAILRAQFNPTKSLPGGPEGVEALVAAVDLGECLVLSNMDLDSLKDEDSQPQLLEALAASAKRRRRRGGGGGGGGPCSCSCLEGLAWRSRAGEGSSSSEEEEDSEEEAGEEPAAHGAGGSAAGAGAAPGAAPGAAAGRPPSGKRRQQQREQLRLDLTPPVGAMEQQAAGLQPGSAEECFHMRHFSRLLAEAEGAAAGDAAAMSDAASAAPPVRAAVLAAGAPAAAEAAATAAVGAAAAAAAAVPAAAARAAKKALPPAAASAASGGLQLRQASRLTDVSMHSALSHPDSIVLDASGEWLQLPTATSEQDELSPAPSMLETGGALADEVRSRLRLAVVEAGPVGFSPNHCTIS